MPITVTSLVLGNTPSITDPVKLTQWFNSVDPAINYPPPPDIRRIVCFYPADFVLPWVTLYHGFNRTYFVVNIC